MIYTTEYIRSQIGIHSDRLFAPWCIGRPDNWIPDSRLKETVVLGLWLREELVRIGLSDDDRKIQEGIFHRYSRSEDDLLSIAVQVMNDSISGNINRSRIPLRRWG